MSKITSTSIAKVAKLSKLSLSQADDEVVINKINTILDLSDELQTLPTQDVNLFDGWRKNTIKDLRKDTPSLNQHQYQKTRTNIINLFPNSKDNLLVVEGIFENS